MVHHTFLLSLCLIATAAQAFDHGYSAYSRALNQFADRGKVNYAALQKNRTDLDEFIKDAGTVTKKEYESWTRQQQLAFWINIYNGWVLRIVTDHYPIRGGKLVGVSYPSNSIQRIPGVWDNLKLNAAGRQVSLNEIEHKILRPLFKEPRIHFSIVCASIGCPLLPSQPFVSSRLESQLDTAARDFINDQDKVRWNSSTKTLELSRVFDWFSEDFDFAGDENWQKLYSKKQAGPVAFVTRYLPQSVANELKAGDVKIAFSDFDWTLNELR